MKSLLILCLLLLPALSFGQKAQMVKVTTITKLVEEKSDRIQVINFWATWCAPCVKELPFFEKLNAERKEAVSVTLVSMDLELDPNPEKVYKFITQKNIRSNVLLLDETNPNEWIDKISSEWSGALPATLVVNTKTGKRQFVEGELAEGQLEKAIAVVE
jgi:thiol-disulfide isomerase/thioredoxin